MSGTSAVACVVHDDPRHLAAIECGRQCVVLDDLLGGSVQLRIHPNETGPRALDCEQAVLDWPARRALAAALLGDLTKETR